MLKNKLHLVLGSGTVAALVGSAQCFAAVNNDVTSAATSIATNATDTVGAVIPIIAGVFGLFIIIKVGKKIINKLT